MSLIRMLKAALLARRAKLRVYEGELIGERGRAETRIAPEGVVFARGLLWRARSEDVISAGESVRVTGLSGITLDVALFPSDEEATRIEVDRQEN
jgi:membrane-bound serine protease (ClpP class)